MLLPGHTTNLHCWDEIITHACIIAVKGIQAPQLLQFAVQGRHETVLRLPYTFEFKHHTKSTQYHAAQLSLHHTAMPLRFIMMWHSIPVVDKSHNMFLKVQGV